MLYKARKEAIKCFDGNSLMVSEAKTKAKKYTTKVFKKITQKVYNNIIKSI